MAAFKTSSCGWTKRVEQAFDGALDDRSAVERHRSECAACAAHWQRLATTRAAIRGTETPAIGDGQLSVFMAGIRDGVAAPDPPVVRRPWLAMASGLAAAAIVAVATFYVAVGGTEPVQASEVESVYTELDGATVEWYDAPDGSMTLQVHIAGDDL